MTPKKIKIRPFLKPISHSSYLIRKKEKGKKSNIKNSLSFLSFHTAIGEKIIGDDSSDRPKSQL